MDKKKDYTINGSRDDQQFLENLKKSERVCWNFARILSNQGYSVRIPPLLIRPRFEERWRYRDDGDLHVEVPIEIKHLESANFSGPHNWPWGDRMAVCDKKTWDDALIKPHAYFHLSADQQCVAIVYNWTYPHWYEKLLANSRFGHAVPKLHYFVKLPHVEFVALQHPMAEYRSVRTPWSDHADTRV
jgi:hypothetical protein